MNMLRPIKKTIAVLPFVNMSSNSENDYFCDGITEEIINALAKIKALKVTSRTSSFFFKGKNIPIGEIGEQLNVAILLEGSIRLAGNTMRITAQLIDVEEDFHFWSETFDRSVEDIFAVQDEISLLIADKLREHLGHFDIEESLVPTKEVSVEAYQQYLKSRFHLLKMTKPDIDKGIEILSSILGQYPDFAQAHLGLHMAYTLLGTIGLMPAQEVFPKGQIHLEKAVALAPELPDCQIQLSWIAFLVNWDAEQAYKHIHQALELRPTVDAYQSMASTLLAEAKYAAALHYIEVAIQIDPLSGINYHLKGAIFYSQEQYEQALACFRKSIELNPNASVSVLYFGQTLILMNERAAALAYFEALPVEEEGDLQRLGGMTLAYAAMGNTAAAAEGLAQLEAALESNMMERALNLLVLCNTFMGRHEQAMDLIAQGVAYRLPLFVYMNTEPCLNALRKYPRFQELMQAILGKITIKTPSQKKYKKSTLTGDEAEEYYKQLVLLMEEKQPYLQASLSLRELAEMIALHPNKLSELLNEKIGKNFSAYINRYRVEQFKKLAQDDRYTHLSLLGLAFESGFNSKTAFNTFFKKEMGLTPKQWLKTKD